ncbi:hypothetical protein JCM8208_004970 [Rhodotorula glutinis]
MSGLDNPTASLGDAQLPPQLEQRLEEERARFHHSTSVDDDLAQTTARHDALLKDKVSAVHAQNEHAKDVAQQHGPSDPANDAVPQGKHTHGDNEPVAALQENVESKRTVVAAQRAELSDLEERLRRADEVEQRLRAALGDKA